MEHRLASASIVECLAHHADSQPDALCLADHKRSLTYRQAWERICGFAEHVRAQGVCEGACVAIECNQGIEYLVGVLAIQLAGCVAVPIEKNAAVARQLEIVAETCSELYIGKTALEGMEQVAFSDIASVCDYSKTASCERVAFPAGEDTAELLFSTGTTGKSKGIVITHRNNMAIAENIIGGVEMGPTGAEAIPMPLSHSHGLRTAYANIACGRAVLVVDGVLALKRLFNIMDDYHATALDLSPSMLSIIFKLSKDRLGAYADVLDYVQLGSAPLAESDKERLAELLPNTRLYNFYGSTEAGRSCVLDFNKMAGRPGCIGRPTANARFIVVDANRNPIESSADNPGLLACTGDVLMRGYFNAPELTQEALHNGYLYTKDLGYIDEDGLLYMLGRQDDVINFGGVKIAPEEVESVVVQHEDVADCACIPAADAVSGQVPVLCVALEPGVELDVAAFRRYLAKALDASKQPQHIEVVDEVPRTFNGKILRRELIARFG